MKVDDPAIAAAISRATKLGTDVERSVRGLCNRLVLCQSLLDIGKRTLDGMDVKLLVLEMRREVEAFAAVDTCRRLTR